MDPMKEALNRRIGKGLQITIIAGPGGDPAFAQKVAEHEMSEEEEKGSDLAPNTHDEQETEHEGLQAMEGALAAKDGDAAQLSQMDPTDNAPAINKPRGSLFHRAEMAQAAKNMKKGK